MAATTLLNAVTVPTTGTGVAITGDVEFQVDGDMGLGEMLIERSIDDVDANYRLVGVKGRFRGPGLVAVRNVGQNYYRARLAGCKKAANATARAIQ